MAKASVQSREGVGPRRRADWLAGAVIAAAVLAVAGPGVTEGGLGWSDAANHTFDGIFVLEFLEALPLDQPWAWAEQFYLRHPALGIVAYYPPGFAVVEAGLFAVFGVSVLTARATVMVFALAAGWMMYLLGRRWFDDWSGLPAALLLMTCPHGALWMNDVMLEWPATFWILLAVYAYQRDREVRRARWAAALGAAVFMAFLTKQTAGFILPVILLHALIAKDRRAYLSRPALIGALVCVAAAVAAYLIATRPYAALASQLLKPSVKLAYYPQHLPEIVGWPLLPIAMIGMATLVVYPHRGPRSLLLLWFLLWSGFSSIIAAKEPRYFFFALVPLAFAAVRFLLPLPDGIEPRITRRGAAPRIALLVVLSAVQWGFARARSTGRLPDYSPAVAALAERGDADLVFVDAVRDGQFILDLYRDPRTRKRMIPLRASKLLYARPAKVSWGYEQFVEREEDIVELLDRYGIRYIVIESAPPRTQDRDADPPPRRMLRRLLAGDARFQRIGNWPLRCDDPAWDDVELQVYAYPTCPPRSSSRITLPIPAMNRSITVDLPLPAEQQTMTPEPPLSTSRSSGLDPGGPIAIPDPTR